jgi:predicted PurR-regulated permease PerM
MSGSKAPPFVVLLVSAACVFIITWGIKTSAAILNPILLAAVITIIVLPMPQYFNRRGLPSWLSFVLTLVLVVGSLAGIVLLVFFSFADIGSDLPDQTAWIDWLSQNSNSADLVANIILSLGNIVVQMFMVMLIFIFMLSGALITPSFSRLGPDATAAMAQFTRLTQDVRRYMSIMTGINFLVGLGNVVLLWIVGVESALVWGLLAWVMGYIPTVGFWIALIPPVLIAYSTLGIQSAAIVFLGYVLINGSVQNFIQPRMMGQGLGISTVVVFISLFVWGWLLGGIGAILSVPLTMIIIAVLDSFENTRWIAILMSAPKEEKTDDRQVARNKFQNLWEQSKHAVQDTFRRPGDGTAPDV